MFGDDILKKNTLTLTATEKEVKQNLFEDQQQQLEATVERLSKMIDDEQSVMANRMQIIDLSILAENYCRKMYEFIQTDLVDNLELRTHQIAPYNSKGVDVLSQT